MCQVPREARLVIVLYGRTMQQTEQENSDGGFMKKEELGWGAIQFFNYDGYVDIKVIKKLNFIIVSKI